MARYMRSDLGRGHTNLGKPVVVNTPPAVEIYGPEVTSVALFVQQGAARQRREPYSRLRPPTVVTQVAVQIFFGPAVTLAVTRAAGQIRKRSLRKSLLRPPAILQTNLPTQVTLAPQRRGRAEYKLFPPTVVTEAVTEIFFGPAVTLAPQRRPQAKSRLLPPAVIGGGIAWHGPGLYLTRWLPTPSTTSLLRPPAVVTAAEAGVFFGPVVHLTRIRPPRVYPDLGSPIVVEVTGNLGWIGIQLAPSRRPVAKSRLPQFVPEVVVAQIFYGPQISLAPSRRPQVRSLLRPPAILATNVPTAVTLAPQRRGVPRSLLKPPTVVLAPEVFFGPQVSLTRITHPPVRYRLFPPAVVGEVVYFGPRVELAPSSRGTPKSRLLPPTVVDQPPAFFPAQIISLAPSSRGKAKSKLFPPALVGAGRVNPAIRRYLVARKVRLLVPRTRYFLRPPVVLQVEEAFYGPEISLAPSFRGTPQSTLFPPKVVFEAVEISGPEVTLTPSRRPITKSQLLPPAVVAPVLFFGPFVELAPSFRGRAKSRLKPPSVVAVAVVALGGPSVNLTYFRRRRPQSLLKRPTVVRLAVEIFGPETWLTYSRRGRPTYLLQPPAVVGRAPFRGLLVSLAPGRAGRPISFQIPFTPGKAPFRPIQVHLTRISPPPVLSLLKPPSVVGAGIAFYGPEITLVRIKHPPVQHFLRLTLVAFRRPQGDVCGFDIAGSFVCYLELPGSQVSGTEAAGSQISGSSRAGSKVQGMESPGGSVSGSDRKAT